MSDQPDGLEQLRILARQVGESERTLAALRSARDEEIQRVTRGGTSERAAATAAGVSPAYAHRASVNGRFARVVRSSRSPVKTP